jgi:hypothetical protein
MAGLTVVRAWRGRVRALLKDANFDLQSLLNYNAKHPAFGLFTSGELAQVINAQAVLQAKIAATRVR